jgi:hypothetical protein
MKRIIPLIVACILFHGTTKAEFAKEVIEKSRVKGGLVVCVGAS